MTLNAVQQYLAGEFDGIQPVAGMPALQAWVLPPPVTRPATQPQMYVWGGDGEENRLTLPRELAQKRATHNLSFYIQWTSSNSLKNTQLFPLLIDAIRKQLRTLNLKVNITDPVTGEASNLTDIGERILWRYGTPITPANQRGLLNTCLITAQFHELFMG